MKASCARRSDSISKAEKLKTEFAERARVAEQALAAAQEELVALRAQLDVLVDVEAARQGAELRAKDAEARLHDVELRIQKKELREQEAEARAQEAEARAQEADMYAQEAESGTQQAESRAQQAESRAEQAESRVREAELFIQDLETRLQDLESRAQDAEASLVVERLRAQETRGHLRERNPVVRNAPLGHMLHSLSVCLIKLCAWMKAHCFSKACLSQISQMETTSLLACAGRGTGKPRCGHRRARGSGGSNRTVD